MERGPETQNIQNWPNGQCFEAFDLDLTPKNQETRDVNVSLLHQNSIQCQMISNSVGVSIMIISFFPPFKTHTIAAKIHARDISPTFSTTGAQVVITV